MQLKGYADLPLLERVNRPVAAGSALVRHLADAVVGSLPIEERVNLVSETLLIVGGRAEESTLPTGTFHIHPSIWRFTPQL